MSWRFFVSYALVLACQTRIVQIAGLQIGRRFEEPKGSKTVRRATLEVETLAKVERFAVVARRPNRVQRAGPQSGEVVDDGAGGPGAAANRDDLVGPFPGFDAGLGQPRIDVEILIEKEIAEDRDAAVPKRAKSSSRRSRFKQRSPPSSRPTGSHTARRSRGSRG